MRDADGRDPGVVDDPAMDSRPLDESAQNVEKVVGFAEETVRRGGGPGLQSVVSQELLQ